MSIIQQSQSQFKNLSTRGYDSITTGIVVNTKDPMQQGRVKVACKSYGDMMPDEETYDEDMIPWCNISTMTGGSSTTAELGPSMEPAGGLITFGEIVQIPEFSTAIVACVDGNLSYRVVLGVIHPQLLRNGLPSGRYKVGEDGKLDGPLTIDNKPLEPIYSILRDAFNTGGHEWITRGVILGPYALTKKISESLDQTFSDEENITISLPGGEVTIPNGYYRGGASGWGITTKGQHFIYMDDRPQSSKIIVRTTLGRQIILDDTNERIYVSTPYGNNFIEMDDWGNFDIFSDTRVSISGTSDVNLSSEGRVRIYGKEGVHILSDKDVRATAKRIDMVADTIATKSKTFYVGTDTMELDVTDFSMEGNNITLVASGSALMLDTGATLMSSGHTIIDGTTIAIAPAAPVQKPSGVVSALDVYYAYNVSRSPFNMNGEGQNWSRSSLDPTKTDNDDKNNVVELTSYNNMEFDYNNSQSNMADLGVSYNRGDYWNR